MSSKPVRVLVVEPHTQDGSALLAQIDEIEEIEVVGVAQSRRAAIQQAENSQPDVLLVDLMLPGYGSTQVVERAISAHPHIHILALSPPGDPPYDRIILAVQAGALGYICRDAQLSELAAAIRSVDQGDVWLPPDTIYEVLRDVAPELAVSNQERRGRLIGVFLGQVPLAGLIAAVTAYFWRQYWGQIGVRVVDLGVDPTTRVADVIVFSLVLLGVFGPLLFVDRWLQAIGGWVAQRSGLSNAITKAHTFRLGRLAIGRPVFNRYVAWVALALLVVCATLLLVFIAEPIVIVFLGPAVAIILLVNLVGLDDQLPEVLHLPQLDGRVLLTLGAWLLVFLVALSVEVLMLGPDLRTDGLHGELAPLVLGLSAHPVVVSDLDGKNESLGALYLGGNADLYVLYDPCAETVRLVPVGSSRVDLIDQVACRSP